MDLAKETLREFNVAIKLVDHGADSSASQKEQIISPKNNDDVASLEFHLNLPLPDLVNLLRSAKVRIDDDDDGDNNDDVIHP